MSGVNMEEQKKSDWGKRIMFLLALSMLSLFIAGFFIAYTGFDVPLESGNVALISIKGTIMSEASSDIFGSSVADSPTITEYIKMASDNPNIKAIIFEIDSPGGSAVASDEIAAAIKKVNKTTVAWIREIGASGGYWVASATDHIVAHRMSITGSIGVISSYLEFSRLLENYNVTYERLVAGKYKDIGSPFKELTGEERDLFQGELDIIHEYFIDEVAANRNLSKKQVKDMATGMFFLGSQAMDMGLVDELGGKEEAVAYVENKLNITAQIAEYRPKRTLLDMLSSVFSKQSFFVGKGIGSALISKESSGIQIRT
jgi:protease-4